MRRKIDYEFLGSSSPRADPGRIKSGWWCRFPYSVFELERRITCCFNKVELCRTTPGKPTWFLLIAASHVHYPWKRGSPRFPVIKDSSSRRSFQADSDANSGFKLNRKAATVPVHRSKKHMPELGHLPVNPVAFISEAFYFHTIHRD